MTLSEVESERHRSRIGAESNPEKLSSNDPHRLRCKVISKHIKSRNQACTCNLGHRRLVRKQIRLVRAD